MTEQAKSWNEDLWYLLFAIGHPDLIAKQKKFQNQGRPPRCKLCLAPFGEVPNSGWRDDQPGPSNRNPRYCSLCDKFIRGNPGGAKVRMTMAFVDVRGSTVASEELPLEDYVGRINDFYRRTTQVFVATDGFMMDVVGDEVFALYPPGFSGVSETDAKIEESELTAARTTTAAKKAFDAAKKLVAVGQDSPPTSFPFGVAVHTGEVYIGTVRGAEDGIFDVRVWGPEVNKAARLCASAKPGEALVSEAACAAAVVNATLLPPRILELKGISVPVTARVLS